ncbi:MAG TPA: FAD-dependent oxidoreductase [Candidatus Paceibacterota bacterium]|jgi:2-polyprenyl-6-methoxyphenol hydroxylase-like FAD-dependent oxidoreductase|nr:FAD-dependent oxidoreductase [Candidatus Paceibacterota bacterium]
MKILIIGGGIAGPALAACLRKRGMNDVTLVERAPEFHNIGLLMGLMGNGRRILRELNIDEFSEPSKGYKLEWEVVKDKRGGLLKKLPVPSVEDIGTTVVVRRSDMHQSLIQSIKGISLRLGTTVVDIVQHTGGCTIRFNDGTSDEFDLVVGADGIHSFVRERIFGAGYLHYYGWRTWFYWLPASLGLSRNAEAFIGDGKLCAIIPFYDSAVAWLMAHMAPDQPVAPSCKEQLLQLFSDFDPHVRDAIAAAPSNSEIFSDNHAYVDLQDWYRGRVVLIGDAQHAVSPVIGMGASMALEDAHVLAGELACHSGDIEVALSAFSARRNTRLRGFHKVARRMESWMMSGGLIGQIRDRILPFVPASYFSGAMQDFIRAEG